MKNLMKKIENLEKYFNEFSEALAFVIERDVIKGGPGSGRRGGSGKPKEETNSSGTRSKEEKRELADKAKKTIRSSLSNNFTNDDAALDKVTERVNDFIESYANDGEIEALDFDSMVDMLAEDIGNNYASNKKPEVLARRALDYAFRVDPKIFMKP